MMPILFVSCALLSAVQQDSRPQDPHPQDAHQQGATAQPAAASRDKPSPDAEKLKDEIHELRMRLVVGGDAVRGAESQALVFYHRKVGQINERIDSLAADVAEKRAHYDVALDRVLATSSGKERKGSMEEAAALRRELGTLQSESDELVKHRAEYQQAIDLVKERTRDRERLASQLETSAQPDLLAAPLPGIGLAPPKLGGEGGTVADARLVDDLLARDPERGRRVVFELAPRQYWLRWPLRPPAAVLRTALPFPLPDLLGQR